MKHDQYIDLMKLANMLRDLAIQQQTEAGSCPEFNMDMWMGPRRDQRNAAAVKSFPKTDTVLIRTGDGTDDHFMEVKIEDLNVCGTACCAMGLAATDPDF